MSSSYQAPPTGDDLVQKAEGLRTQATSAAPHTTQHSQGGLHTHGHHSVSEAFENLEKEFEKTTGVAVEEGKEDVDQATASYLEKALSLADVSLSTAQTYITQGKERLNAPHQPNHPPPTGLAATFATTATAALDAASRSLGIAHDTLHQKAPHIQHHGHPHEPAHPVTVPSKPLGEALSENVAAVQAAAQPHLDAAQAAAQPHIDAAQAAAQPHIDAVKKASEPYVTSASETAAPYAAAAVDGAQAQIDSAKAVLNSDKPLTQQAQEAGQAAYESVKPTVDDAVQTVSETTQEAKESTISDAPAPDTQTETAPAEIIESA